MTVPALDRRIQRTRGTLQDALVALMEEKGYDAITVQDILDRANVGRSTFYAHFQGKQDLLMGGLDRMKAELTRHQRAALAAAGEGSGRKLAFGLPMLMHVGSHARLYKSLVGRPSGAMVLFHIQRVLADLAREELAGRIASRSPSSLPLEAVVQATVGAFLALVTWWMDQRRPCSAEELDALFQALVLPGLA